MKKHREGGEKEGKEKRRRGEKRRERKEKAILLLKVDKKQETYQFTSDLTNISLKGNVLTYPFNTPMRNRFSRLTLILP